MVPPEFTDLVNQSDYIVRAVVKSVVSDYAKPGSKKIVTQVELEVKEVIAGKPPSPLVLHVMGGKVGQHEMIVEGAPQFTVGEESVLFIRNNGRQIIPLVAMMHGIYPIRKTADGSAEFVARDNEVPLQNTAEAALPMTSGEAAQLQRRMTDPARALTPEQFIRKIREAVQPGNTRLREQ